MRNTADRADPPSQKAAKAPEMQVWTGEQLARFLTLVDGDRYRAPLLFLAMTGCRRGEALGLRWNDVDFDERVVRIRLQLTSVGHVVAIKPRTKSDKPRVVELDGVTIAMLKTWRAQQSHERLLMGPGYDDGGLVFCHADGRRYDPEKFSRASDRILGKRAFAIELPRIRLHDLRHTWGDSRFGRRRATL